MYGESSDELQIKTALSKELFQGGSPFSEETVGCQCFDSSLRCSEKWASIKKFVANYVSNAEDVAVLFSSHFPCNFRPEVALSHIQLGITETTAPLLTRNKIFHFSTLLAT
ncbi:conserved hypothetical protein [Trichinella spiralis]|uniref:hypothetical protein n=1 Tax=Trichinella spiralis TaxID=6334 RepID=UPI0001EFC05D|nr:conserved hypothetical protein [Trichinella spiralis]